VARASPMPTRTGPASGQLQSIPGQLERRRELAQSECQHSKDAMRVINISDPVYAQNSYYCGPKAAPERAAAECTGKPTRPGASTIHLAPYDADWVRRTRLVAPVMDRRRAKRWCRISLGTCSMGCQKRCGSRVR